MITYSTELAAASQYNISSNTLIVDLPYINSVPSHISNLGIGGLKTLPNSCYLDNGNADIAEVRQGQGTIFLNPLKNETGSITYLQSTNKYYMWSSSAWHELPTLNPNYVAGWTGGVLSSHMRIDTNYTLSAPRITASIGFSGSGANIININAGNISSGTLDIARGGTNNTSYTNGRFLVYDGTKIKSSDYSHNSFAFSTHNHDGVYLSTGGGILHGSLFIVGGGSLIQGEDCSVNGGYSHAQGQNTFAGADFSHAQGIGTTASGPGQLVVGRYNYSDPHHVFIIGCGDDNDKRSNAYYVSAKGENVFEQDVIFNSRIFAPSMSNGILTITAGQFSSQTKNSAYNKNFGNKPGDVCQGDDQRLSDARTPTSHAHGEITDAGAITTEATLASGDKLIISDASDASKLKRSTLAIGSDTNKYLRNDGTWEIPPNTTYTAGTGLTLSSTTFNHTVSNGFYHLPSSGTSGEILVNSGTAGSGSWASSVTSLTIGGANYSGSTVNVFEYESITASSVVIPTYDGVFFDYKVKNSTNIRIGTVMACHDGTYVQYTQNSTMDLGNTSDIKFEVRKVGANLSVIAINSGYNRWTIKSMIRAI